MADNFDLRQFLTENKLTKNAKLLKEEINSNVEDIAGAFHEAGLTGMVTVLFQSDSSMGEPDIYTMPAERAMKSIIRKAANAESVIVVQGSEITKGEQIGDYEEETEGLECKVIVEILDKGVYEIYQGSNDLEETSRSMKNKMNEARVEGFDVNKKAFEVSFVNKYGGGDFRILNAETPEQAEEVFTNIFVNNPDFVQSIKSIEPYQVPAPKPQAQSQPGLEGVNYRSIEIDGVDSDDYPDFVDAYVISAEFEDGTPLSEEELEQLTDELYQSGELADMAAQSLYEGKKKPVMEASYKVSKNSKEAQHLKKGDIIGSGDEVVSVSAGAKTPSGKVEVTLKTKDGKTKTSTWGKTTKVGVKQKETVKENTMTERDKYLTRLVENALGMQPSDDDEIEFNPADAADELDYRRDQYRGNQMEEGDEMVEEKPLPKYENIEKLMQEIDKNTDEEAHKFKMQEMKRVADMLEKKCTALEEGDDADHIDKKKLKQMKKDTMTLRKGIEKMEKLGEKKFAKKETKQSKPAATLAENRNINKNTMENQFDLKKFLTENNLTTNSKSMSERIEGIAYEVLPHIEAAYKIIVAAHEDVFSELAGDLEDIIEELEDLAGIDM